MHNLRKLSIDKICDYTIITIDDLLSGLSINAKTKSTQKLPYPPSNVLIFYLEDKTTITVRPSGTEPKVKIYIASQRHASSSCIEDDIKLCDEKIDKLSLAFQEVIDNLKKIRE